MKRLITFLIIVASLLCWTALSFSRYGDMGTKTTAKTAAGAGTEVPDKALVFGSDEVLFGSDYVTIEGA